MYNGMRIITLIFQFERSSSGKNFNDLARGVSVSLNGHLHRLVYDLGARMLAHQISGLLELELVYFLLLVML
jgi:hypothetical protein